MLKKVKYAVPVLIASCVLATDSGTSTTGIGGIAANVKAQLVGVADLISQVAFVAGMGFFVAAVFKFKQHKDNPTQVPVGTPLTMIVISAALMFMGNFIQPLGETLFTDAQAGSSAGDIRSGFGAAADSAGGSR